MKRLFLSIFALGLFLFSTAANTKVYINPGHGSWGPNCRPMATINYAAGDTLGFFESNTNLWKAFAMEEKLKAAGGFDVKLSRRASGGSGTNQWNKALSTICSEATNYGANYYISIHSNAGPDGSTGSFANYPVILYRGYTGSPKVKNSDAMAKASMARLYDIFYKTPKNKNGGGGPEFTTSYSPSNPRITGDLSFYNTSSTYGYLGALKHNIPGFLSEGYFHTYSPARHRALNPDWCREEGIRYFRGLMDYYGKAGEKVGYILGYVRSKTEQFSHKHYIPHSSSNDIYKPINGAKIVLRNDKGEVIKCNCYPYVKRMLKNQDYYTTDHNYNGVFFFENLTPGQYTLYVHASGYKDIIQTITVTADKTIYPEIFMEKGTGTEPDIDPIDPDITWILNGGIVPGGAVPTNAELWETFETAYCTYYGVSINKDSYSVTNSTNFLYVGKNTHSVDVSKMMTDTESGWKWLGDYIQQVNGSTIAAEVNWRFSIAAFFQTNAGNASYNVDFTTAGQPSAWGDAYRVAHGISGKLPSTTDATYTLPTPVKEGDEFVGWYENPKGEGEKLTTIPAGYKGTIYAIWKNSNPDSEAATQIITWVLNGGQVLGGTVPSNEELWTSFMDGFNSYYTGYSNASGTFKSRTTRPITEILEFTWTNIGPLGLDLMTDPKSPWKWLGDYILSVASSQGISIADDAAWRQNFYAFFNCTNVSKKADGTVAASTIDFTNAGKPEAWGDAYREAKGMTAELPTKVASTYTLPIPTKAGATFYGWFTNPEGTGDPLTSIPAGWYGTLYAIWEAPTGMYVVTASANNAIMGTVTGGGNYKEGTKVTLTATPNKGYIFVNWSTGETSDSLTLTVTEDITIIANFAAIGETIFELNGGKKNPHDWSSKEDMWETFMDDYCAYYNLTNYPDGSMTNVAGYTYKCGKIVEFLTDQKSSWKWLETYIQDIIILQGHDTLTTDITDPSKYAETYWRWNVHAFFGNTLRYDEDLNDDGDMDDSGEHVWPHTADFTEMGKEENWYLYWGYTFAYPTKILKSYALPKAYKEGYTFLGWYDNEACTGDALTELPYAWSGTVYAKWQSGVSTDTENIQVETVSVRKVLLNGQILIIRDGKVYNMMGQQVN